MKFEVKTQNDEFSKSTFSFFLAFILISFIILFSSLSLKLGTISRIYEINYLCKLLTIEKTSKDLKKLSKLTNLTSKQKMWELCREIIN